MQSHWTLPALWYAQDLWTCMFICAILVLPTRKTWSAVQAPRRRGFTSIACMPNTRPTLDSPERILELKTRAAQIDQVQIYPIASVSYGQLGIEMTQADALRQAGAVALSDDGMPISSANLMRDALIRAKAAGLPILSHCEDASMVEGCAVNEGRISRRLGIPGRPAIAEEIMVMRDTMLAAETGSPVHICHVSTRGSVEIIRAAKKQGIPVTCETCPQYFTLTEEDILTHGTLAKVNPPLRTPDDVQAIIEGLQDDTIDVIATDHAPHSAEEKALPLQKRAQWHQWFGNGIGRHAHRTISYWKVKFISHTAKNDHQSFRYFGHLKRTARHWRPRRFDLVPSIRALAGQSKRICIQGKKHAFP